MRFFMLIFRILVMAIAIYSCSIKAPDGFKDPPREFSVMPFWFWNDTLKDEEIIRQIADFENHGVFGFVIHPRIGLPENVKWLSGEMIRSMHVAIGEAAKRNMFVILYDEGMYPSGSSAGQVVAANPAHAARGLAKIDLKKGEDPVIPENAKLITIAERPSGDRVAVIEQPSGGVIRGLHYLGEGTPGMKEETHPAGDILNPEAVGSFMNLVYEKYAAEFGRYFGTVIMGIFTDEPSSLGRGSTRGMFPGNAGLIPEINRIAGYDIKPFLSDLWYDDNPGSEKHRSDYLRAVEICLGQTYYARLGKWCEDHGLALMGHPAGSMDIGAEKYFQVPGQDLVWRYVEPGEKALKGQHSTMAKCASGAMIHLGLRRNSNELYGAYGHNLTFDEMQWLANWCFVRGHNLLYPHAFYYSVRGPRRDERPPDVGPNSAWWDRYKPYADACRRLSWINTDSRHVCGIAILAEATMLPDMAASALFRNQLDFNYLENRHLAEDAEAEDDGIHIRNMQYKVLIIDSLTDLPEEIVPSLKKLASSGRLLARTGISLPGIYEAVRFGNDNELLAAVKKIVSPDLLIRPASEDIRCRHLEKDGFHYYMLFNEGEHELSASLSLPVKGRSFLLDAGTGLSEPFNVKDPVTFLPHEMKIICIK